MSVHEPAPTDVVEIYVVEVHEEAPTDVAPTNVAPTNVAPTNVAPTNVAPTNVAPTNVEVNESAPTDNVEVPQAAPNLTEKERVTLSRLLLDLYPARGGVDYDSY